MAAFDTLKFIPNDSCNCVANFFRPHYEARENLTVCSYGYDVLSDELEKISDFNFLTKPFADYDIDEKYQLKNEIQEYLQKQKDESFYFYKMRVENIFNVVLMYHELISIRDFLFFMEWAPIKNSEEFYICLKLTLVNVSFAYGENWRNQKILLEQVKVFFGDFNADVNYQYSESTSNGFRHYDAPLHTAVKCNMPKEVIDYLLSIGADPRLESDHSDITRRNIFYCCLPNFHTDILDLFKDSINHTSDPNPFAVACDDISGYGLPSASQIHIFEKLLELGFDINKSYNNDNNKQYNNVPPIIALFQWPRLYIEVDYHKYHVLVWFIDHGANVNAIGEKGQTLLHYICRSPYYHYTHPHIREYILKCPLFNWHQLDQAGIIPCEYLLDYHLVNYQNLANLPNFLCQVILNTGLGSITNNGLPNGLEKDSRLKLAKVILYLKYVSLQNQEGHDILNLKKRIMRSWNNYYYFNKTQTNYNNTSYVQIIIYNRAKAEACEALDDPVYCELVKKIIMTDYIAEP